MRSIARLAGLCPVVAAAIAFADEQVDYDDAKPSEESFWGRAADPGRARFAALIAEGRQLHQRRQQAEAVARLREAVRMRPDDAQAMFLLGEALGAAQLFDECAATLLDAERVDPAYAEPGKPPAAMPFLLAHCLSHSGRPEAAASRYQRVIASGYGGLDAAVVHLNLGDCYQALGRLDEAIDEYTQGVARSQGRTPRLFFALGAAYDRDEQLSRSREALREGLRQDQNLAAVVSASAFFLPPEDRHYYTGLAHRVAHEELALRGRRAQAISSLRSYLAAATDGPWSARARQHLVELGSPALTAVEIEVRPAGSLAEAAVAKSVMERGPELQRCLEAIPGAAARLDVTLMPAAGAGGRRQPAVVRATTLGTTAIDQRALDCIVRGGRALDLPAPARAAQVSVSVIAP